MIIKLELFTNGITCWYKENEGVDGYHRDGDHPAVIHSDGSKEYCKNGQIIYITKPDGTAIYIRDKDEPLDRR